ncbi:hypothetical protein DOI34_24015 [Salmonella enterica subsp. enterica serovar Virchow]|nr:hypothetical protein [Salmonella enterica subsp. enterica serovar Virchow]EBW1603728.1 hypothetical protein [Salmonella enterica subsp. enterica serovar Kottbus]ECD4520183.1 hypothetical protein [Salmonella enterica subsp. enterica serovar Virchow]MIL08940.1 hypothetical protein [Salmonella enterica subsp. enterica serovar Enteritidis]
MYNGYFVDDQDKVYADLLSRDGMLKIEHVEVSDLIELAKELLDKKPDIVALDYRLDEKLTKIKPDQTYKGSALAQHLRDVAIDHPEQDFPLILVSSEEKLQKLYRPDRTAHDLFDRVYAKSEIRTESERVQAESFDLCVAYDRLRELQGKYDVVDLTRIDRDDADQINFQEFRELVETSKAPHLVVKSFYRQLIKRVGPLLSKEDVAARLGVPTQSVQPALDALDNFGCRYKGLLSEGWHRWWLYRFDQWAEKIFGGRPVRIPANARAKRLSEALGEEFPAAKSPWNGRDDELISFACACCRLPAEIRHSVSLFDSTVPRYSTVPRICWDCVQTDRYLKVSPPLVIADSEKELVKDVLKMDRKTDEVAA